MFSFREAPHGRRHRRMAFACSKHSVFAHAADRLGGPSSTGETTVSFGGPAAEAKRAAVAASFERREASTAIRWRRAWAIAAPPGVGWTPRGITDWSQAVGLLTRPARRPAVSSSAAACATSGSGVLANASRSAGRIRAATPLLRLWVSAFSRSMRSRPSWVVSGGCSAGESPSQCIASIPQPLVVVVFWLGSVGGSLATMTLLG
jgi:hypothetical protein